MHSAKQEYELTVTIEPLKNGNLRLAFSKKLAETFGKAVGARHRIRPGLIDSSQNYASLEAKCWLIHADVVDGKLDSTLEKYAIQQNFKLAVLEPLIKNTGILEI